MIENVLNSYLNQGVKQVQFRLSYRTLIKKNEDWIQSGQNQLAIEEWEDLKDLCLTPEEKVMLETKGQVKGQYGHNDSVWIFSFIEWKNCFKAHFFNTPRQGYPIILQNPIYWDALNLNQGLHLVSGLKGQGKTHFVTSMILEMQRHKPQIVVTHGSHFMSVLLDTESMIHLGEESEFWDISQPVYDGADTIVIDASQIKDWKKWIRFSEEGRRVIMTISAASVEQALLQIYSELSQDISLWYRFLNQISSVINQKIIGAVEGGVHEVVVFKDNLKSDFRTVDNISAVNLQKHHYQTYNQSLLQALIRRRIDVKTAFAMSPYPDDLDVQLKKMGL